MYSAVGVEQGLIQSMQGELADIVSATDKALIAYLTKCIEGGSGPSREE